MFMGLIKKFKSLRNEVNDNRVCDVKDIHNDFVDEAKCRITISSEDGYHKVILSDYVSISEFTGSELLDLISMNISWDCKRQKFYNGSYYIITDNGIIYNILINDKMIKIDERIQFENYSHEKVITFDLEENKIDFFRCKHTLGGSSYDTMYYHEGLNFNLRELELDKDETFSEIITIFNNLDKYSFIQSILDFDMVNNMITDNFGNNLNRKK